MAELVDASDSKSGVRKDVQVRFLFWARQSLVGIYYKAFSFIIVEKSCPSAPTSLLLSPMAMVAGTSTSIAPSPALWY
jgi:hypothetical protein